MDSEAAKKEKKKTFTVETKVVVPTDKIEVKEEKQRKS
jgi:hypothetical protein